MSINFTFDASRSTGRIIISIDQNFVVNSTVINSGDFKNSMFASLKVKDAIADYFRENYGKRPNVDIENPDIIINVHIQ